MNWTLGLILLVLIQFAICQKKNNGDQGGSGSVGSGGDESVKPGGDGSGKPEQGDGSGKPDEGDGSGKPDEGDGSGKPRGDGSENPRGDGSGKPDEGDGSGKPDEDDGSGKPRGDGSENPRGDGSGKPDEGDGSGKPRGDGSGKPDEGDGSGKPGEDDGSGKPGEDDGSGKPRGDGSGNPRDDGSGKPDKDDGSGNPHGDGSGKPGEDDGSGNPRGDGSDQQGCKEMCEKHKDFCKKRKEKMELCVKNFKSVKDKIANDDTLKKIHDGVSENQNDEMKVRGMFIEKLLGLVDGCKGDAETEACKLYQSLMDELEPCVPPCSNANKERIKKIATELGVKLAESPTEKDGEELDDQVKSKEGALCEAPEGEKCMKLKKLKEAAHCLRQSKDEPEDEEKKCASIDLDKPCDDEADCEGSGGGGGQGCGEKCKRVKAHCDNMDKKKTECSVDLQDKYSAEMTGNGKLKELFEKASADSASDKFKTTQKFASLLLGEVAKCTADDDCKVLKSVLSALENCVPPCSNENRNRVAGDIENLKLAATPPDEESSEEEIKVFSDEVEKKAKECKADTDECEVVKRVKDFGKCLFASKDGGKMTCEDFDESKCVDECKEGGDKGGSGDDRGDGKDDGKGDGKGGDGKGDGDGKDGKKCVMLCEACKAKELCSAISVESKIENQKLKELYQKQKTAAANDKLKLMEMFAAELLSVTNGDCEVDFCNEAKKILEDLESCVPPCSNGNIKRMQSDAKELIEKEPHDDDSEDKKKAITADLEEAASKCDDASDKKCKSLKRLKDNIGCLWDPEDHPKEDKPCTKHDKPCTTVCEEMVGDDDKGKDGKKPGCRPVCDICRATKEFEDICGVVSIAKEMASQAKNDEEKRKLSSEKAEQFEKCMEDGGDTMKCAKQRLEKHLVFCPSKPMEECKLEPQDERDASDGGKDVSATSDVNDGRTTSVGKDGRTTSDGSDGRTTSGGSDGRTTSNVSQQKPCPCKTEDKDKYCKIEQYKENLCLAMTADMKTMLEELKENDKAIHDSLIKLKDNNGQDKEKQDFKTSFNSQQMKECQNPESKKCLVLKKLHKFLPCLRFLRSSIEKRDKDQCPKKRMLASSSCLLNKLKLSAKSIIKQKLPSCRGSCELYVSNTEDCKFSCLDESAEMFEGCTLVKKDCDIKLTGKCESKMKGFIKMDGVEPASICMKFEEPDCMGKLGGKAWIDERCGTCVTKKPLCCEKNRYNNNGKVGCCGQAVCSKTGRCSEKCAEEGGSCSRSYCGKCIDGDTGVTVKDVGSCVTSNWHSMRFCMEGKLPENHKCTLKGNDENFNLDLIKSSCSEYPPMKRVKVNCYFFYMPTTISQGKFEFKCGNDEPKEVEIGELNLPKLKVKTTGQKVSLSFQNWDKPVGVRCSLWKNGEKLKSSIPMKDGRFDGRLEPGSYKAECTSCAALRKFEVKFDIKCVVPEIVPKLEMDRDCSYKLKIEGVIDKKLTCPGFHKRGMDYISLTDTALTSINEQCFSSCGADKEISFVKPDDECRLVDDIPPTISTCGEISLSLRCYDEDELVVSIDGEEGMVKKRVHVLKGLKVGKHVIDVCKKHKTCCVKKEVQVTDGAEISIMQKDQSLIADVRCSGESSCEVKWLFTVDDEEEKELEGKGLNNRLTKQFLKDHCGKTVTILATCGDIRSPVIKKKIPPCEPKIIAKSQFEGGCAANDTKSFPFQVEFNKERQKRSSIKKCTCDGESCGEKLQDNSVLTLSCGDTVDLCCDIGVSKFPCAIFSFQEGNPPPKAVIKDKSPFKRVIVFENLKSCKEDIQYSQIAEEGYSDCKLDDAIFIEPKGKTCFLHFAPKESGKCGLEVTATNEVDSVTITAEVDMPMPVESCRVEILNDNLTAYMDMVEAKILPRPEESDNSKYRASCLVSGEKKIENPKFVGTFEAGTHTITCLVCSGSQKDCPKCSADFTVAETTASATEIAEEALRRIKDLSTSNTEETLANVDSIMSMKKDCGNNDESEAKDKAREEITETVVAATAEMETKTKIQVAVPVTKTGCPEDTIPQKSKDSATDVMNGLKSQEAKRKRRSAEDAGIMCTSNANEEYQSEAAAQGLSDINFNLIYPIDYSNSESRQTFLDIAPKILEIVCTSGGEPIVNDGYEFHCLKVDNFSSDPLCFNDKNCIQLDKTVMEKMNFANLWECDTVEQCIGVYVAAFIVKKGNLMSEPDDNFKTCRDSMEVYFVNPSEGRHCIMETTELRSSIKLFVNDETELECGSTTIETDNEVTDDGNAEETTTSAPVRKRRDVAEYQKKCFLFVPDSFQWYSSLCTTHKQENSAQLTCTCAMKGSVIIAETNQDEKTYVPPTTTTTTTTTTTSTSTTTTTTEMITEPGHVKKEMRTTYAGDYNELTNNGSDTSAVRDEFKKKVEDVVGRNVHVVDVTEGSIVIDFYTYLNPDDAEKLEQDIAGAIANGDLNLVVNGQQISAQSLSVDGKIIKKDNDDDKDDDDDNNDSRVAIIVVVVILIILGVVIIIVVVVIAKKQQKQKVVPSPATSYQEMRKESPDDRKTYSSPRSEAGISNPVYEGKN